MFFERAKPKSQEEIVQKKMEPNQVCETHRIIACRTCYPISEPAKEQSAIEADVISTIDLTNLPKIDATTLTFLVWLMYKLNVITRIQVRDFLALIKDGKWPADVVKYLQDEVRKI